jgi:hypothetical protein
LFRTWLGVSSVLKDDFAKTENVFHQKNPVVVGRCKAVVAMSVAWCKRVNFDGVDGHHGLVAYSLNGFS